MLCRVANRAERAFVSTTLRSLDDEVNAVGFGLRREVPDHLAHVVVEDSIPQFDSPQGADELREP